MSLATQALTTTMVLYELYASFNHQTCVLASHRNYKTENFYTKMTNLMCHLRLSAEGQKLKFIEVGENQYHIEMYESFYNMQGWKWYTYPQDDKIKPVVAHKYESSIYQLEMLDENHCYIKDVSTGLFLTPDPMYDRDRESVFIMAKPYDEIIKNNEGVFYLKKTDMPPV